MPATPPKRTKRTGNWRAPDRNNRLGRLGRISATAGGSFPSHRPKRATALVIAKPADGGSGSSVDRKSAVSGKSVSVRVDLGGRRSIKKQKTYNTTEA